MTKKTAIIGSSTNPQRYAYLAAQRLQEHKHEIVPLGIKKGNVFGKEIQQLSEKPAVDNLDTITLYLGPDNQTAWQEYLLSLNPKRIIFNPGTENPTFARAASSQGIEVINACTLVMLSVGNY